MSQSQIPTRTKPVRRPAPTTAKTSQLGVAGSLAFHAAILAATLVSLHSTVQTMQESHIVPVDLVRIADKTDVAAQSPPTPPQPDTTPLPPPAPLEAPPAPQMQQAEPAPVPDMPKFKVAKEKPVEAKPDAKPDTKAQQKDFSSLLDRLTAPQKPLKNAKAGDRVIQAAGSGTQMTADLISALQSQIYRCWSPPTGVPNPADVVVDYAFSLNPDGTLAGPPQLLTGRGNSYTRAAADAALRAIATCQPYRLPQRRYQDWKDISRMHFDPRQYVEQ